MRKVVEVPHFLSSLFYVHHVGMTAPLSWRIFNIFNTFYSQNVVNEPCLLSIINVCDVVLDIF